MKKTRKEYLSKKDKTRLINKINNTKIDDEEQVFDLAILLCRWSVKLRSEILRRSEYEED